MSSEWRRYTVDELIAEGVIAQPLDGNHGAIHPKASDFVASGIPFIMASDLKDGQVDTQNCAFISREQASGLRKGFAREGDVLLSHKATIGRTALVQKTDFEYLVLTPQVTYYRSLDPNRLNNRYLKFYFDSSPFQQILGAWAGAGSTRAYIGITAQRKLPIVLPPINVQNVVAETIGALDDRITLLRETNATLESIAQALFKSWFVDFDPVRAKQEGRAPEGMSDATAALFPDGFEESELGLVPRGWRVAQFADFIERQSVGKKYDQKSAKTAGSVPILDQGKSGIIGFHDDKPGVTASLDEPVVVFANHTCYMRLITFPFSVIQNVLPFKGKGVDTVWAYYATQGRVKFSEYKGHWPDFAIEKAPLPDEQLTVKFREVVDPLMRRIQANDEQAKNLAEVRDTLLPRLISGQLRLPEAEAQLEGALA